MRYQRETSYFGQTCADACGGYCCNGRSCGALPGMPCCPITGLPMIEPVVCADGHTYERHAISRWLLSSNRSPLTGAVLPHTELAPNYLLISSLGSESSVVQEEGEDNVILEEHPGLLDVLK